MITFNDFLESLEFRSIIAHFLLCQQCRPYCAADLLVFRHDNGLSLKCLLEGGDNGIVIKYCPC